MPSISRSRPQLARLSRITVVWAVVFGVVHLYWAAGGRWLGSNADAVGEQLYIAMIALIGLLSAVIANELDGRRLGERRQRRLVLLARGGGLALLFGVVIGTARWLVDWSLGGEGAAGIVITSYFLVGGVLFSLLGWTHETHETHEASEVGEAREARAAA